MYINKILTKKSKIGRFTSELYWYKIDDIWIDNTYHVIVKDEKGNIVNEIDTLKKSIIYKYNITQILNIYNIKKLYVNIPENAISNEPILIDPEHEFWIFKKKTDKPFPAWVTHNKPTEEWKVIDATSGIEVAIGIPVPKKSLAVSGPHEGEDIWYRWRESAANWYNLFNTCYAIPLATVNDVISNVQDSDVKYYYNIAHGNWSRCQMNDEYLLASYIETTMNHRNPMTFTFLAHCDAMNYTDIDSFSYNFRKGETTNTVTVGYTGMGDSLGWIDALNWQNVLFTQLYNKSILKDAFDYACATYPRIIDAVKYDGDENLKLCPKSICTINIM